ncbi:MAG: OmpA family protein [Cytophagales bacterium]|nr:OmpA family protein [Cytophagales bacterium]
MKNIILLLSLVSLVCFKAYSDEVSALQKIRYSDQPVEGYIVEITINKGTIGGVAQLQQKLPPGCTVTPIELINGTYSFNVPDLEILWSSLPPESEFTISYLVVVDDNIAGVESPADKFQYLLNNLRGTLYLTSIGRTLPVVSTGYREELIAYTDEVQEAKPDEEKTITDEEHEVKPQERPKRVIIKTLTKEELKRLKEEGIVRTAYQNLEFEFGSDIIRQESYVSLEKLGELLMGNPEWGIELTGHTDNVGSDQNNLSLSYRRAIAVKKFLANKDVKNKIIVRYYGEVKPVVSNKTASSRQKNRRVEIDLYRSSLTPELSIEEFLNAPIKDLEFKSGSDIIEIASYASLEELIQLISKKSNYRITISGYTDNVGNAETNLVLSKKRASAVKRFFSVEAEPDRITIKYYGETKPISDNSILIGRKQNRRVEIVASWSSVLKEEPVDLEKVTTADEKQYNDYDDDNSDNKLEEKEDKAEGTEKPKRLKKQEKTKAKEMPDSLEVVKAAEEEQDELKDEVTAKIDKEIEETQAEDIAIAGEKQYGDDDKEEEIETKVEEEPETTKQKALAILEEVYETEPETEEKAEVEKKIDYTQEEIEAELKRMQEDTVGGDVDPESIGNIPTKEDTTKPNPDLPADLSRAEGREASAQAGQEKKSKKKKKSKKPKEEPKEDVGQIDDPSVVGRIDNPSIVETEKETVEEATTVKKVEEEPEGKEIIYKVQIAASRSPLQDSDLRFQGIQDVTTQKDIDGWYRYFAGSYRDFKAAKTRLNEIIKKGIKDAWISKYKGFQRMID